LIKEQLMSGVEEQTAGAGERRRSRGGAEARRAARTQLKIEQFPYIVRKIPLVTVLDEEGLSIIERNADTILQEVGIEFRDEPEALKLWQQAGADVKGTRIRFPRGLCRSIVQKTAPRAMCGSAATRRCSRRSMARPSSARSTMAGVTRPSRIFATS
jgi:trimethylamine--corrinoid protein Co-methyltransferase